MKGSGCPRGAARLIMPEALPLLDKYADIQYEGSIAKCGDNGDFDWGMYTDEKGEWVLMEADGPGCLYNFTQHRYPTSQVPVFRFYFDGAEEPQFTIIPAEFGTKYPFVSPLADKYEGPEDNGVGPIWVVRSFVPMEFRTHCKVTSSLRLEGYEKAAGGGGWGHVLYHTYESAEGLTTFTGQEDLEALLGKLRRCGEDPKEMGETLRAESGRFVLKGGEGRTLLERRGGGAVTAVRLALEDFRSALLQDVWLRLTWEDAPLPAVEAPIGTFFGCEYGDLPADQRLYLLGMRIAQGERAEFYHYFPMPFWEAARVELLNRGGEPVTVSGAALAYLDRAVYDRDAAGYFTASPYYRRTANVHGKNSVIAEVAGAGHMVYGCLSGAGISSGCEGDVRVFIDDRRSPTVESDGSESWASYGWGFVTPPQCNPFSGYNGQPGVNEDWSMVRLTAGDSYPFKKCLRFELEHGCANDGGGSHSGQIFCYLREEASMAQTDEIQVGELQSEQEHAYEAQGGAVRRLRAGHENGMHEIFTESSGRAGFRQSRFRVKLDPRNQGVLLRRLSCQEKPRQLARIFVDGRPVEERRWLFPDSNPYYAWIDDTFLIPPAYTQGRGEVELTIVPETDAWNEFCYTVYSIL